ncbi:MAG TPA: ergothioneine biosynthesis protein EgtB, partial [Gammaproteobacteria bacterium]|nr:ergothioneine biosynthesis protein EgtB [Gammaproteobacteria bacterium]
MNIRALQTAVPSAGPPLPERYGAVRTLTLDLCRTLTPEDMALQSIPDASPAKWHLAHTSWFFEQFVLGPHAEGYKPFHPDYAYLFNSYYQSVGEMHPRPARGLLSRPSVADVRAYREHVDGHMQALLAARASEPILVNLVALGLNHEQQHQELLLMDIKHLFSLNPLKPAWRELPPLPASHAPAVKYLPRPAGQVNIGHGTTGFAFDNETPRHGTLLTAHAIASRPVNYGEYRDFIRDGGYRRPELWLSDGWVACQRENWQRPLYWDEDMATEFTLGGMQTIVDTSPVCHLSWYEADAYARWAGARLPTEAEWESLAAAEAITGNFLESGLFRPTAGEGLRLFGDVWEWTSSPYTPYPGFKPLGGSLGEYNGKFMANQFVLRGGACVTPASHIRASYRNFFYPQQRWQFGGLRLA